MKYFLPFLAIIIFAACNGGDNQGGEVTDPNYVKKETPTIAYNIVNVYPHDTSAYTQGLQIYNGKFYEGTGDYTNSALQISDIKTGKVIKKHKLGKNKTDSTFGEGITILNGKLYQLTWLSNIAYVYDVNNIDKPIKSFPWPYQYAWGITNNGNDLLITDGSANLYIVNPETFKVKSTLNVTENGNSVTELNELEFINGFVYANIYQTDFIVKIDPISGHVVGKMNLSGLKEKYFFKDFIPERTDVLNGIAYDSASKKMYVTGKRWPKMFEIVLN